MLRVKLIILGLFAAFSVSAVAAGSAAAEPRYFVEKAELKLPQTYEAVVSSAGLNSEIGSVKIMIKCDKDTNTGTLETEGKQKMELGFANCTLFEIKEGKKTLVTTCVITQKVKEWEETISYNLLFGPFFIQHAKVKEWTEVISGGGCLLKGTYTITGSYNASMPGNEVEAVEHEIVYNSIGSEMKFGSKLASLTLTTNMKLTSGKKWFVEP